MAGFSKVVRFDAIRTLAFGAISGTYAKLGVANAHLGRVLKIINNTNGDIFISFDGSTDNDFIPASNFCLYDLTSNLFPGTEYVLERGTQIWVKQSTAPTSGSVYATIVYGQGE